MESGWLSPDNSVNADFAVSSTLEIHSMFTPIGRPAAGNSLEWRLKPTLDGCW